MRGPGCDRAAALEGAEAPEGAEVPDRVGASDRVGAVYAVARATLAEFFRRGCFEENEKMRV